MKEFQFLGIGGNRSTQSKRTKAYEIGKQNLHTSSSIGKKNKKNKKKKKNSALNLLASLLKKCDMLIENGIGLQNPLVLPRIEPQAINGPRQFKENWQFE